MNDFGMGHNSRGLIDALAPAYIRHELETATETIIARRDAMIECCCDFAADHPEITNDGDAGMAADVLRQAKACGKQLEDSRVGAKEPFLAGGRVVDGFFKPLGERLVEAMRPIQDSLNRRVSRVTAHRRALAEVEAQTAAERARQAEEEARASGQFDGAIAAAEEAAVAEAKAAVNAAELSRVHTDLGGVVSGRETWHFDVLDRTLIPPEFMVPDLAAIGRAVRRHDNPLRSASGLRIYSTITAGVR